MDPVANMAEQKHLAQMIQKRTDEGHRWVDDGAADDQMVDADRLAELVLALDEWRQKGGFLPAIAA